MNAVKFTPVSGELIRICFHYEMQQPMNQLHFTPSSTKASNNNVMRQSSVVSFHGIKSPSLKKKTCKYLNVASIPRRRIHQRVFNSIQSEVQPHASNSGFRRILVQQPECASTYEEWGYLVVDVIDRGCGIPEHARGNIFREFFQFDPDRLQGGGGSGMGLWISREIVRMHGGDITFGPGDDGVGTIFSVWLPAFKKDIVIEGSNNMTRGEEYLTSRGRIENPLSQRNVNSFHLPVAVPAFARCSSSRSHSDPISDIIINDRSYETDIELGHSFARDIRILRVMIVDDSFLNRRILRKIIERVISAHTPSDVEQQIRVVISECDDGAPAVEAMAVALKDACPYDYVFMDNIMIRMNGPEAALAMRKNGYRGYIIGVTGNVLAQDMNQFVQCGADFVLTKPVDLEQIKKIFGW